MWHSYFKDLPGKDYAEKAQFLSKFHQLPKGVFLSGLVLFRLWKRHETMSWME
jgi:hypothetical protein